MAARSPLPLLIAIMALLLAIASYAIADESLGRLVYASGLLSAVLALFDWFATPLPKRRAPPRT